MYYSAVINDKNYVKMSNEVYNNMMSLREYLFNNVYKNPAAKGEEGKVEEMIVILYEYFLSHFNELPKELVEKIKAEPETLVCDYISGMTDRFAISMFTKIYVPKVWKVF